MSSLEKKIQFVVLAGVTGANANGDPISENMPRTDYNGYGMMSDVCIKRKIRNRLQDMGEKIFVQSDDRCDDGFKTLKERASETLTDKNVLKDRDAYAAAACAEWIDVRAFGQVFAFKGADKNSAGTSVPVRGPVTLRMAKSVSPISISHIKITKSVNGEETEKKGPDTMGSKYIVDYGLYKIEGSISPYLAEKTGFTDEDAEKIKQALMTLFENDASAARPEGSMDVIRVYWFESSSKEGQYPASKVFNSVKVKLKDETKSPASFDDYEVTLEELPGLTPEVIECV